MHDSFFLTYLINIINVIVDCFGNTRDGDIQSRFHTPFVNLKGTPMSAISSNNIQLTHLSFFQKTNNLVEIEPAATGSQHGTSFVMNIFHQPGREGEGWERRIVKSLVSSLNAVNLATNAVELKEGFGNVANDIVETRAETVRTNKRKKENHKKKKEKIK